MPASTRSNTFTTGETILAAEVNEDLNDLFALINDEMIHADGTNAFTAVPAGPSLDPSTANQLTRKSYVDKRAGGIVDYKSRSTGTTYETMATPATINTWYNASSSLNISVSEVTDHWYRATWFCPAVKININATVVLGISVPNRLGAGLKRDGVEIARTWAPSSSKEQGVSLRAEAIWKATSDATTTINPVLRHANLFNNSAAIQYASDTTFPMYTLVEDMGLSV